MQIKYRNIYQSGRLSAGISQEAAAERLNLSVESLRAYETGIRTPPASTVRSMADVYGAPGLRLEHARQTDELGLIPREARPRRLEQLALRILRRSREASAYEKRLAEIAEDGEVDEAELADFEDIQAFVASRVADYLALECCATKKDRPEGASLKAVGVR